MQRLLVLMDIIKKIQIFCLFAKRWIRKDIQKSFKAFNDIKSRNNIDINFDRMKVRHLRTENSLYSQHLTCFRGSTFDRFQHMVTDRSDWLARANGCFPTNYLIVVHNPYLFVLLHLKKQPGSTNQLAINIPDVCIFDRGTPFDVLYSSQGDIKGLKLDKPISLRQVYSFFKNRSQDTKTKKEELSLACFENEQFLMMSDADLYITCRKHKSDPFFKKLQYLRNKLNLTGVSCEVLYDQGVDCKYAGAATECFAGYKTKESMLLELGEDAYLKYCCQKIALFLNYQQNIRVKRAIFCYSKTQSNQYYLTNVRQIEFHNLSWAIEVREKRLREREAERSKILEMSNQKYQRYKSEESKPLVKQIEAQMNSQIFRITEKLSLNSDRRHIIEQAKTRAAFHKLYPNLKRQIPAMINTNNFTEIKRKVLQDREGRKITRPSKFMKKCYNIDVRIRATYAHFPLEKI